MVESARACVRRPEVAAGSGQVLAGWAELAAGSAERLNSSAEFAAFPEGNLDNFPDLAVGSGECLNNSPELAALSGECRNNSAKLAAGSARDAACSAELAVDSGLEPDRRGAGTADSAWRSRAEGSQAASRLHSAHRSRRAGAKPGRGTGADAVRSGFLWEPSPMFAGSRQIQAHVHGPGGLRSREAP